MITTGFTGWRKSSYSSNQGNCVEIAWRKSTYSSSQANCVEVARAAGRVGVRDSKQGNGPALAVAPAAFTALLDRVAGR